MKKAKGLFAVVVILIVAGASGALWYLNDSGKLGGSKESEPNSFISWEDGYRSDANDIENENNDKPDNMVSQDADGTTSNTGADNKNENGIDNAAVNEFLSNFSRVYFAENQPYSADNRSTYELIRFAYSHLRRTDKSVIVTKEANDSVRWYSGVPFDEVNNVLKEFFGVTVNRESVYTENDYMFFRFENGVFYTPATDGVGYTNLVVADDIRADGETVKVDFTIYSDGVSCDMTTKQAREKGEKYKSGSATLRVVDSGYVVEKYSVK